MLSRLFRRSAHRSPERSLAKLGQAIGDQASSSPSADTQPTRTSSATTQASLPSPATSAETGLTVVPSSLLRQECHTADDARTLAVLLQRVTEERDRLYANSLADAERQTGLLDLMHETQAAQAAIDTSLQTLVQLLNSFGITCSASWHGGSHHLRLEYGGLVINKYTRFTAASGECHYHGGELQVDTPEGALIQLRGYTAYLQESGGQLGEEAMAYIVRAMHNIDPEVFKDRLLHATRAVFNSVYGTRHLAQYELVQHLLQEADNTNDDEAMAQAVAAVIGLTDDVISYIVNN